MAAKNELSDHPQSKALEEPLSPNFCIKGIKKCKDSEDGVVVVNGLKKKEKLKPKIVAKNTDQ